MKTEIKRTDGIFKSLKRVFNLGLNYDIDSLRNNSMISYEKSNTYDDMNGLMPILGSLQDVSFSTFENYTNLPTLVSAYFKSDYMNRREFLREFAKNSEISRFLDIICDEVIFQNSRSKLCLPVFNPDSSVLNLKADVIEKVRKKMLENFYKLEFYFGINGNSNNFWVLFRQFLVDGFISFEIIYDNDQNIIGFKQIDPLSIIPTIFKVDEKQYFGYRNISNPYNLGYDDVNYGGLSLKMSNLFTYAGNPNEQDPKNTLSLNQIINIAYSSCYTDEISYLEQMIRSFNMLHLLEQTCVIWSLVHATYRTKITVPIGNASKARAEENIREMLSKYNENYRYDDNSGVVTVNDQNMPQYFHSYVLPQREGEGVDIEPINDEGPDFNSTDLLDFFKKKLITDSKIPANRIEGESDVYFSSDSIEREEARFSLFCQRTRDTFFQLLLKPLKIMMSKDFPKLAQNNLFLNSFTLEYLDNSYFTELREMEMAIKRFELVDTMQSFHDYDDNGIFSIQALKDKLKFDPAFWDQNKIWLDKEAAEKAAAGGDDDSGGGGGGGGGGMKW